METLEIKTQITSKQYQNLLIMLVVKKPFFFFFSLLGVVAVLYMGAYLMGLFPEINTFPLPVFIFVLGLVLLPVFVLRKARNDFKTNPRVNEPNNYVFDEDGIGIAGDSFTSIMTWEDLRKVTEMKDWIACYDAKGGGIFIPKHNMTSNELVRFRAIVEDVDDLTVKLKG
ncbi:MAG: YcxB family protein [Bacteroidia bacterium]